MAEDSDLERTEPASQRRLDEARKKGQVPRSHELTTCATLLVGLVAIIFTGPDLYAAMKEIMVTALSFQRQQLISTAAMGEMLFALGKIAIIALLPVSYTHLTLPTN